LCDARAGHLDANDHSADTHDVETHRRRMRLAWPSGVLPTRTTTPVGLGVLGGIVGFLAGTFVGVNVVGDALIDGNPSRLLTSALVGAGIGWVVGAAIGFANAAVSEPTRPWMLRAVGFAAVLIGVGTAWYEQQLVGPGGLSARYLSSLRVVTIVDATAVGLTFAIAAGREAPRTKGGAPFLDWFGRVGVVLGAILALLVAFGAIQTRAEVLTSIRRGSNMLTAERLSTVAADYFEEHGAYPEDLDALLAAGGRVRAGSVVNFAGVVRNGFCVRVGTEVGLGYGAPPFASAVVHPRPPRAKSWTAAEAWSADTCGIPSAR
jgi:hypothetical protein